MDRSPVPDRPLDLSTPPVDSGGENRAPVVGLAAPAVEGGFAALYGRDADAAQRAFAADVQRDPEGAVARLAARPGAYGTVVGGPDLAARQSLLTSAIPAAVASGAFDARGDGASRPAVLAQERDPDPLLRRALDFLYELAESPGGAVAMAVGSVIPGLDQALDVVDIGLNLDRVSQPEHRGDVGAWTNLGVTVIGAAIPFAGDTVEAALKSALGGGRRAAGAAMETLAPVLRRAGLDPAEYLDDLARRVPELFSSGLDLAADRLGGVLDGLATPRRFVPDSVERAAGGAADSLRALAMSAKEPLRQVSDEISGALRDLADAARRGADDATPPGRVPDGPGRTPDGRPPDDRPDRVPARLVAERRELASEFYASQGMDPDRISGHLDGIDFDRPVEVVTIPRGTAVEQYGLPGIQGNYYTVPGTRPETVGISLDVLDRRTNTVIQRERATYVLTEDVQMLRSTAASIEDTWSVPGRGVPTQGGGLQLFSTSKSSIQPSSP